MASCHCYRLNYFRSKGVVVMVDEKNTQTEANKKWQDKNREKARYLRDRSTARSFIKNRATLEDLQELKQLIEERNNI
jgi:hypothetical protein